MGSFAQAVYLGIHRITNDGPAAVNVETENTVISLETGNSVDVSSTLVKISLPLEATGEAKGTYMLLCCSLAVAQGAQLKSSAGGPGPAGGAPAGGAPAGGGPAGGAPAGGGPAGGGPAGGGPAGNAGLDALQALLKEIERLKAKLKIAREHGESDAAEKVEKGLLAILEGEIGKAAIADARRELQELGKAVHDLGGGPG